MTNQSLALCQAFLMEKAARLRGVQTVTAPMRIRTFFTALACSFIGIQVASAHVVVRPNTVAPGAFQTFTVGVPNEKDMATTGLRLVIPEGLQFVSPTVKPGWTITVTKDGETVKEIAWTGGTVPVGQRDDFTFSAKAPAAEGELAWKAYQTYADGTVVAWDQPPAVADDHGETEEGADNPYSVTNVSEAEAHDEPQAAPLWLGTLAAALAVIALGLGLRR